MSEFDCPVKDCGRRACNPAKCKLYKEAMNRGGVEMSEAREMYYKNKGALIGCDYNIVNPYIKELEQQNKELKEALRLCMTWLKKVSKSMPNYDITQSVLWKNFKELLE